MKPGWAKLIEQWQDARRFGLTLPFLIGALREWPGQPLGAQRGKSEMLELLSSVRTGTPDGSIHRIATCSTIHEIVLAKLNSAPSHCTSFAPSQGVVSLYVEAELAPTADIND